MVTKKKPVKKKAAAPKKAIKPVSKIEPVRNIGGRPKGKPKTGGRKPGSVNKATREVKALSQGLLSDEKYQKAFKARLISGKLPPAMEALLWHYAYGKPKENPEGPPPGGVNLNLNTKPMTVEDSLRVYEQFKNA